MRLKFGLLQSVRRGAPFGRNSTNFRLMLSFTEWILLDVHRVFHLMR